MDALAPEARLGHRDFTRFMRKRVCESAAASLRVVVSSMATGSLDDEGRKSLLDCCELSVLRLCVRRACGVRSMRSRSTRMRSVRSRAACRKFEHVYAHACV